MSTPPTGADVAYDEVSPPEFTERLEGSSWFEGSGIRRTLHWQCPRCTHSQAQEIELEDRIVALTGEEVSADVPRRGVIEVFCACQHPHEGRPPEEDYQGCGYRAKLTVER